MKTKNTSLLLLLTLGFQIALIPLSQAQTLPGSPFVSNGEIKSNTSPSQISTSYPYTQTFLISAYYSPLPGQEKYATDSYENDIRLNGSGVHGADGTNVYPGMVAAPGIYPFGTKMKIPGIGTVAVHDRGGAIVESGERENIYDRLDIWMGYGDAGLQRALNWGKRSKEVTVYGVNSTIKEKIELVGYSENEKYITKKTPKAEPIQSKILFEKSEAPIPQIEQNTPSPKKVFTTNLQLGDSGADVTELQKELQKINLLGIEPTGYYGEVTAHAVFKFQQKHELVSDENSVGAGVFGPQTQNLLNNLVAEREEIQGMMKEN